MRRVIHHTFGPHVTWAYYFRTAGLMLQPWKWRTGKSTELLRSAITKEFGGDAYLFSSGREALLALLRSLPFEQSAEVIIQGYTCVVLPNAIHAAGYSPVYADIDPRTLNLNLESVRARITPRTRAIICQHTFGIPADVRALQELCNEHNLVLIEDCAHIIPDEGGPGIGNTGQYTMMSFGRDKAISGITGGAIVSRNSDISTKLLQEETQAIPLSLWTIFRLLLYPETYLKSRMVFRVLSLGKLFLKVSQKLHMLVPILTKQEKSGYMSTTLYALPNACASLALSQWNIKQKINDHRRKLASTYKAFATTQSWNYPTGITQDLPLQKFPVYINDADGIRKALKRKGIYLEDGWTMSTVCPRTVDMSATNYIPGSCPHAEQVSTQILSLPTHPTMTLSQATRLQKIMVSTLQKGTPMS